MSGDGEGRVRPRSLAAPAAVLLGIAVVGAVSLLGSGSADPPATPSAAATPPGPAIETVTLDGRLVFAANAPDGLPGLRQRLYVVDLSVGSLTPGPRVPATTELVAVADGSIAVVSELPDGRRTLAFVPTLDEDAVARTLATGSFVAPAASGRTVRVIVEREGPPCEGAGFVVHAYRFSLGSPEPAHERGPVRCGTPISVASDDGATAASILDGDGGVVLEVDGVRVDPPLGDVAILAIGRARTALMVRLERPIDLATPAVGPLLAWPFAGGVRPAVDGLVATRFVGWSPDGRYAVVNGELRGERAMWLVDPSRGTATAILPSAEVELGTWYSGAAFDAAGNVYGAGAGVIVVANGNATAPLSLPSDAPVPAGPIVWLP